MEKILTKKKEERNNQYKEKVQQIIKIKQGKKGSQERFEHGMNDNFRENDN